MCGTWALESKVKGTLVCTLEARGERELLKRQSAAFKSLAEQNTIYSLGERRAQLVGRIGEAARILQR